MNTKIGENRRLLVCGSRTEKVRNGERPHRGIEPRCDFLHGYSLLNHVNAVATAWGLCPGSFFLVQQRGTPVAVVAVAAAVGVFGWLQVTGFDFGDFLLHFSFPLLGCLLFLLYQWHQERFHLNNPICERHR